MGWTKEQVDTLIEDQMAAQPEVADLVTNTSQAALWRQLRDVASRIWLLLEATWLRYKAEIQAIAEAAVAGTSGWYAEQMLKFQYGDVVVYNPTTYRVAYPTIDESKRIIKFVAVRPGNGSSLILVAKAGPAALSPAELTAAQTYLRRVQFAGAQIDVISRDADLLKLQANLYYDGLADLVETQTAVEAAIGGYLAALDFAGQLRRTALVDAVQAVPNIIDVDINELSANSLGTYQAIGRAYEPISGYFAIDPAYPLNTELTYIAQ